MGTGTALRLAPTALAMAAVMAAQPGAAQDWVDFVDESTMRIDAAPEVGVADPEEKDLAVGDVDNDGLIDVVVVRKVPFSTPGGRRNVLFLNVGGVITDVTEEKIPEFLDQTDDRDVLLVDVDGDGWLDIVTATTFTHQPRIYMNLGEQDGVWQGFAWDPARLPTFSPGPKFCAVAAGDVTGDGKPDLFFVDYSNNLEDRLLINDGNGFYTDETTLRLQPDMYESAFGTGAEIVDLDGDGRNDILRVNTLGGSGVQAIYNDPDNPGFFNRSHILPNPSPYMAATADLNQDGRRDVYVVNDAQDRYHFNTGTDSQGMVIWETHTVQNSPGTDSLGGNIDIKDIDGDGILDIVVSDVDVDIPGCSRHLVVLRGQGTPPDIAFSDPLNGAQRPWLPSGSHDAKAIDVDGDGLLDLVVGTCAGLRVYIQQGSGPGEPVADISPSSFEFELVEGEADGATLSIGNTGDANLVWSISEDEPSADRGGEPCNDATEVPWLSVAPDSGTTPPDATSPVEVTVDSTGLAAGIHEATLCVTTNDPSAQIVPLPVTLTVEGAGVPIANITPQSLAFEVPEDGGDSDTLDVGNIGTADLVWSITEAGAPGRRGGSEVVQDGGFEAGTPNPSWDEGSTGFGTPLCTVADCGFGGGTGPHGGGWWAWFGGVTGVVETGFVAQEVTIPSADDAVLRFWLEIPAVGTTGFLDVSLGGDVLFSVTDADAASYATYTEVVLDVSAYADGATRALRFDSTTDAGGGELSFFVDDVSLVAGSGGGGGCDDPGDVPWLAAAPSSGTTPPGGNVPVTVTVDASGLAPGDHAALLCVTTNDPADELVEVPVSLTVVEGGAAEFAAVALTVDPEAVFSDGNGVLEPGELVDVAPSWRNLGGVPASLTGTATDFTGPAGASYAIAAANADYGLVAGGATASCLDTDTCYRLGLNDPEPRPAAHWDAVLDEELSDGTTQSWTVHIGRSFTDVPTGSLFYRWIETLFHNGVTGGCAPGQYCPAGPNTRAQMAVFLLRSYEDPGYLPPACVEGSELFGDVPFDSPFCRWIEELAGRGVTSGCGGGSYCPNNTVSRDQMTVFLLRTLEGAGYTPPACAGMFGDVPCPSLFADWIEDLVTRGITAGCGGGSYCPASPVSRDQMAVFMSRTFGLTLYGP